MEFLKKTKETFTEKGDKIIWAKFKCSFCLQIVERQLSNGKIQKSCGCVQYKLSAESNKNNKNKKSRKGKNNPMFGKYGENHPAYGNKHTEKFKQDMSEAKKGSKNPQFGKVGTNSGKVFTKEHRQNISKSKKGKNTGELASNWQNGKSFEVYPIEFKQVKKQILERDNYTCQYPNCTEVHDRLHVHHIDYNKQNNTPENLTTLCHSCHMRTTGKKKRVYFIEYYQNAMINRIVDCLL